jgi:hypothetical protein
MVQVRRREQTLLQFVEWSHRRRPVLGMERRQERSLLSELSQRPLRVADQGPHRGQGLGQWSGGREFAGTKSMGRGQRPDA